MQNQSNSLITFDTIENRSNRTYVLDGLAGFLLEGGILVPEENPSGKVGNQQNSITGSDHGSHTDGRRMLSPFHLYCA